MSKKPNKKITHQNSYFENDEIDLFGIIDILFKFKLRIILFSIIATFLGLIFYFSTPKSYELAIEITPAKSSFFLKYFKLNRNIEFSESLYSDIEKLNEQKTIDKELTEQILITNLNIFQNVLDEFSDYDELKEILNQQKNIDKINLNELDEFKKSKTISSYSKNFKILKSKKNLESFNISLLWHDPNQGLEILNEITNLVLKNVQTSLVSRVNQVPEYLEFIKNNKIELLEKKIKSIANFQKLIDNQRILHLSEQAEIARVMGLANNSLYDDSLNIEISPNDFNYKNNSTDYLRGYEVLDKERELLQNRTQEELLLSNNEYSKIQNEIDILLNNDFEIQMKKDIDLIRNDNPYDWINYDLGFAKITPNQQPLIIYLLYSFFIGLILSSIFTLIYSNFQHRKTS